jgi:hypothetical protein
MRKPRTFLTLLALCLMLPAVCHARDIALYNDKGQAVAYIDTSGEGAFYLWGGQPVAYLDGHSIYGFNGKHLGWLENGIIWGHAGNAVGFIEGAVNIPTQLQSLKGLEQLTPLKSLKELEPLEPMHTHSWSSIPLALFLSMGNR